MYSQRLPELLLKYGIPNIILNQGVGGSHTGKLTDNNRHRVQHAQDRLEEAVLKEQPYIKIAPEYLWKITRRIWNLLLKRFPKPAVKYF